MSGRSPFIVAEVSANHLGDYERARQIVKAAATAGADAVKFQTWSPDTMCLDVAYELTSGPWAGRGLVDLYEEAYTPWMWHEPLFDLARRLGLEPFSAAFDQESVDFLEKLGVHRHKVASFELVDTPLIRHAASKGKPLILSTGMARPHEIVEAYAAAQPCHITWLKCTSAYPARIEDANLATIPDLARWLKCEVGLSDHTLGHDAAVVATALGATMIEKHLTLSRADGGPDASFSMEPDEFAAMVKACRRAAAAVGEPHYGCTPGESTALRRSVYAVKPIEPGQPIVLGDNARTARPALGMSPAELPLP